MLKEDVSTRKVKYKYVLKNLHGAVSMHKLHIQNMLSGVCGTNSQVSVFRFWPFISPILEHLGPA